MSEFLLIIAACLLIVGSIFCLLACIGILRFPDVFSRMHAASKAGSIGAGFMLLAVAFSAEDFGTSTRAVAGVIFVLLTAPIAAHLLAKASYEVGYRMWKGAVLDEMSGPGKDHEKTSNNDV